MSASANGTGAAAPKEPKGDGKGKDDTIAKVTGVVVATGIAYSLYKSFVVFRKKEEPLDSGEFDHAHSEPFHEQISIEKPKGLSEFEAGVKGKAGQLKDKAGEWKGAGEGKGRDVISAFKGKGQEAKDWAGGVDGKVKGKAQDVKDSVGGADGKVKGKGQEAKNWAGGAEGKAKGKGQEAKDWAGDVDGKVKGGVSDFFSKDGGENDAVEEGKEYASEKGEKAKETGFLWWRKASSEANKDKDHAAKEAEKAKEEVKTTAVDSKRKVEEKTSGFFDKAGAELGREKDYVTGAVIAGEKNVERGASAVAGKASELAHKVIPGGGKSKSGESAWSKTGGSKGKTTEYGIVRGDTLWSISRRYGVSIEGIKTANGIWNVDYIVAGDTLTIPK